MSEDDSLEKLKKQLYSRKSAGGASEEKRPLGDSRSSGAGEGIRGERAEHQDDWTYEEPKVLREPIKEKKTARSNATAHKRLTLFVIISAALLLLSSAFVIYRLFFASALISPRNVSVEIDAPATARAGDAINFDLSIENKNSVDLLDAKLVVSFPEDTLSADESGAEVDEVELALGTIPTGAVHTEEIEALLFGQEGDEIEIEFYLDYGTVNSNARLSNTEVHTIKISTAPVSILVAPSVRQVQSGNQFEIEVDVKSNTNAPLDDLLLEVEYPGGFNFVSSNPATVSGDRVWRIGDLDPQESETVTLRGFLEGQNNEERVFKVRVGEEGEDDSIGRLFASADETITITAPQISLSTQINKSAGATVSSIAGEEVSVTVNWASTLRDPLKNMVIEAEFDNDLIEPGSVKASKGFYRSSTGTISWDRTTDSGLGDIDPLERGSVSFSFRIADGSALSGSTNPEIPISISATASEPQGSDNTRRVENRVERVVRIASNLILTQSIGSVIGNPPRAESESIYRITWAAGNSGNAVENASIRAALPTYVTFVPEEGSDVKFSPLTNEVIWNIGKIDENVGFSSGLRTSFELSFIPSASQVGSEPILIYDALIEGRDAFTGSVLRSRSASLQSSKVIE